MHSPLRSTITPTAMISLCLVLLVSGLSFGQAEAGTPTVNGLYYGDGDEANYYFLRAADGARGSVYYNLVGDTLYVLMLLDGTVNDNVFGIRSQGSNRPDGDYLASGGWESGSTTHQAADLIGSDHLQVSIICGDSTWSWRQDYLWDADDDDDPLEADWLSDHLGPDAVAEPGTPPPGLIASASSMQWNMNNTLWDVTLGGHRTTTQTWKSADDWFDPITGASGDSSVVNNGYNEYDATWQWEWPMIYEMAIDLSLSGPITITVISAHNSPVKDQGDGGDEMENVPVDSTQLVDYGDAPEPTYPTNLANDGARHYVISNGPFLGAIVDAENDGQPSVVTTGDDVDDGTDDEDGVVFTSPLIPGGVSTVDVTASGTGFLNAWMDFNDNGSWGDAGEQIFTDESLSAGINNLSFSVPGTALIGGVYARFRFSTASGLAYTGSASDGEVEDYLVTIAVPVELSSFTAGAENETVRLMWTTQSEEENLGFHIYRSTEEKGEYAQITQTIIPGAGTSNATHTYAYVDLTVETGTTYYYKVGDISADGTLTYHGPVRVAVSEMPLVLSLSAPVPQPMTETSRIHFTIPYAGMVELSLYNLAGHKQDLLASRPMNAGNQSMVIPRVNDHGVRLQSGTYVIRLITPVGSQNQTLVITD